MTAAAAGSQWWRRNPSGGGFWIPSRPPPAAYASSTQICGRRGLYTRSICVQELILEFALGSVSMGCFVHLLLQPIGATLINMCLKINANMKFRCFLCFL